MKKIVVAAVSLIGFTASAFAQPPAAPSATHPATTSAPAAPMPTDQRLGETWHSFISNFQATVSGVAPVETLFNQLIVEKNNQIAELQRELAAAKAPHVPLVSEKNVPLIFSDRPAPKKPTGAH